MCRMSQKLLRGKRRFFAKGVWGITLGICLLGFMMPPALLAGSWRLKHSIERGPGKYPLHYPLGLYFDAARSILYVADSGNNRLISYDSKWKPLKIFDAAGQLQGPIGMAREKNGNLWVVERSINSLTFINLKQRKIERHHLTLKGEMVLVDKLLLWRDKLVVLDRESGKILVLGKGLTIEKVLSPDDKGFKGFFDVKAKGDTLWGMETLTGRLFGFDAAGNLKGTFTPKKHLPQPVSFERDADGNVYLLDRYLKKLLVFNSDGSLRYEMLKQGFNRGQLSYPWLLLMVGNSLLVLDEGNGRIDVWER